MKECSKSVLRRLYDPNFARLYFKGDGVDIGGKPDPLSIYSELFPLVSSVRTWDIEDGDAQYMANVANDTFDFIHSSHCLEHLRDPAEALANWMRILRPGGHLVLTMPDEDLYEQGQFPSTFNRDHKWTFTVFKHCTWSERSINLLDLLRDLGESCDIRRIMVIDEAYRHSLPRYDQTLTPITESAIEVIVRKRPQQEIDAKGRLPQDIQPNIETRIHLNQYRDDQKTIRAGNQNGAPFQNTSNI